MSAPLRLALDGAALADNYRLLAALAAPAGCGAAVKADGYGLGARAVVARLAAAGCRDFFVATWAEAADLAPLGVAVSVLHGLRAEDVAAARALPMARPVLNTPAQVERWRAMGGGACDVMVDTGMNRLGLSAAEAGSGLLDGLAIDTLMSHLASADEESAQNDTQRAAYEQVVRAVPARRRSLANSAGIALGARYAFDLVRPGLALYGGVPRAELAAIGQVVTPEAEILQRRRLRAGETIGYNATFRAAADTEVAIINLGYADGMPRALSGWLRARCYDRALPTIGRLSMDLIALNVNAAPELVEGDWVALDFALPATAAAAGVSQYELLTGLGGRFDRRWR